MRKGLTLTLTTIAAALLVTSAMALGPTIRPIPDVYITSNTTAATPDIAADANMFRYSNAFVLWDYITPGDTTSSASLYWAYAVKAATLSGGSGSFLTGTDVHYSINAVSSIAPTEAEGTGAWTAEVNGAVGSNSVADAGALTFRNERLSPLPDAVPYPAPVAAAGAPAGTLDCQEATLYVTDKTTTPGFDRILLVTVQSGVDTISGGLKWTTERTYTTYTGGTWSFGGGQTIAPFTATNPMVGTIGASSTTINCGAAATTVHFFGAFATNGVAGGDMAAEASKFYRLQVQLSSSNTAVSANPDLRVYLNGKITGPGFGCREFSTAPGTSGPVSGSPVTASAFLWPAASGNMTPSIMVFDDSNLTGGTITVGANAEVKSVAKADLLAKSSTVLADIGSGASTAFGSTFGFVGVPFSAEQGYGGALTFTSSAGATLTGGISGTLAASAGGLFQYGAGNVFTATAGKLVLAKVSISASVNTGTIGDPRILLSKGNDTAEFFITRNLTAGSGPMTTAADYYAAFMCDASTAGLWNVGLQGVFQTPGSVGSLTFNRVTVSEMDSPID